MVVNNSVKCECGALLCEMSLIGMQGWGYVQEDSIAKRGFKEKEEGVGKIYSHLYFA